MNFCQAVSLVAILGVGLASGCGSGHPTVIEPTETYELTDQERQNRARADAANAEERPQ